MKKVLPILLVLVLGMSMLLTGCGGDGKDFVNAAMDIGADLYLTGEAGYNMAADAAEEGLVVVEAGHYHTEAPICRELAAWLCRETGLDCTPIGCCPYGYR